MNQFSIPMNLDENPDHLRFGAGSHGHLFNNSYGWPTPPHSAPMLQYRSSVRADDETDMMSLLYNPSLPSNDFPHNPLPSFSGLYHPSYQGHPEGVNLVPSLSPIGLTFDDCDPIPTESSSTYTSDLLPSPSLHRNSELDGYDASLSTAVPHGSVRDSRTVTSRPTASLYTRSTLSTPSSQPPVISTNSAIRPTSRSSNHFVPPDRYSDHGDRPAPSDFRSVRQGRQHTAVVSHGNHNPHWCRPCNTGFSQKQGFRRHIEDVHIPRRLCPYCKDFEWSLGRKYELRKHLEARHPGVELPKTALRLRRQDPRGSRRALRSSISYPK